MRVLPAIILRELAKGSQRQRHFLRITVASTKILRFTDAGQDILFNSKWYMARGFEFDNIQKSIEAAPDSTKLSLDNTDGYWSDLVASTDLRSSETVIFRVWLDNNLDVIGASSETDLTAPLWGYWDKMTISQSKADVDILDESIKSKKCRLRKHSPNCRWVFKGTECTYAAAETWCDYTRARCVALSNQINFGGFQWLLDLKGKEISWGGKAKQWKYR